MRLEITLTMDNEAFDEAGGEVNRILAHYQEKIYYLADGKKPDWFSLFDVNGNKVGKVELID